MKGIIPLLVGMLVLLGLAFFGSRAQPNLNPASIPTPAPAPTPALASTPTFTPEIASPLPASHTGTWPTNCTVCHVVGRRSTQRHMVCPKYGGIVLPYDHVGMTDDMCWACHRKGS